MKALETVIYLLVDIKLPIMKKNINTLLLVLIFIMMIAQMSCTTSDGNDKKAKDIAVSAPTAQFAFILNKSSNLSSSVRMPGELIAYQQVDLYAKVSSFIKKLYVDVGSEVSTGQLLAVMEAPEMNSQLSGAQSRLKSQEAVYLASKANYDRLLETSKTPGTISRNDLDQANAKQKSDQAQLDAAKSAYKEISDTRDYLQIRAPFSGMITGRNVSAGAYVGPSGKGSEMPIFTLQEQKKLRLVVSVPESYSGYLSNRSEVAFTIRSIANQQFKAKVSRLAGALDSRLHSQHIEMDVLNNDRKLLPGMVAEVFIPLTANANAFIVPSQAVLNSTQGVFVIKVQNKRGNWVPVTTGRNNDNKTEIFGNLSNGDTLIAHAGEEIRNGALVSGIKVTAEN